MLRAVWHTPRPAYGLALLALALSIAGCAGGGTSGPTAAPAATSAGGGGGGTTQNKVGANDQLKFDPPTITVAKGTTVTWSNTGQQVHTVTFDPSKAADKSHVALPSGAQPFDLGNLNAGQTVSHMFDTPGTYKYICVPHEATGMTGTVVVTG